MKMSLNECRLPQNRLVKSEGYFTPFKSKLFQEEKDNGTLEQLDIQEKSTRFVGKDFHFCRESLDF